MPPPPARVRLRLPLGLVVVRALPQLGAGGADRVDLGARRVRRDEDRRAAGRARGGEGERAAVVARRRGDQTRRSPAPALSRTRSAALNAPRILYELVGWIDFELQVDVGRRSAESHSERRSGVRSTRPRIRAAAARMSSSVTITVARWRSSGRRTPPQDLGEVAGERRSRQHLVRAGLRARRR